MDEKTAQFPMGVSPQMAPIMSPGPVGYAQPVGTPLWLKITIAVIVLYVIWLMLKAPAVPVTDGANALAAGVGGAVNSVGAYAGSTVPSTSTLGTAGQAPATPLIKTPAPVAMPSTTVVAPVVNSGPKWKSVGCWRDTSDRALKGGSVRIGGSKDINEADFLNQCYAKAKAAGAKYFAKQDGNECFWGPAGSQYNKYGKGNCYGHVPGWTNKTYEVLW